MRILLVEDDRKIGQFLERGLREEGHRVTLVTDLAAARARVDDDDAWDVWIVDRMLPDGDGLSLIREARRGGNHTPALCLTARDRVDERVEGLTGGADDYVLKPFAFEELLARLAAVTRRRGGGERIEVADLSIDPAGRRVFRAGTEIKLTAREFELLKYLAERPGRVVTRTRLLEAVWDTSHDPGTNVVDVYVSYLRAKIDKGFDPPLLHTVRGVGYVLEAEPR
jgi:two-component system OmpR family response regulator